MRYFNRVRNAKAAIPIAMNNPKKRGGLVSLRQNRHTTLVACVRWPLWLWGLKLVTCSFPAVFLFSLIGTTVALCEDGSAERHEP